jgi:hypothetical protein
MTKAPVQHRIDNRWLIYELMARARVRPIVAAVVRSAYEAGYEEHSDGITLMPELEFRGFGMKHPAGVGHDWLYFMGTENPYLNSCQRTETEARRWADKWFRLALYDFGHPYRAAVYWLGLRLGAWASWRAHRCKGNSQTEG